MGQMRVHPYRTERDMQSLRSPAVVKSQWHGRPARAEGLKAEGGGMREATAGSEKRLRGGSGGYTVTSSGIEWERDP